jgi:hypothetical protein
MRLIVIRAFVASLVCLTFAVSACAGDVSFKKSGDDIVVHIGGEVFTTYRTAKSLPKPFFHPVLWGGTELTRPVDPDEREHPHHKGIWVSIDEVNGLKHWAERAKIVNIEATPSNSTEAGSPGVLKVVNHWLGEDGRPAVVEWTTIRIYPNRLMIYDINFHATDKGAVFEDTKEGLLGFRMAHSMRESEGGKILAANGVEGSKDNWGRPNKWIDYYGPVEGKTVGVTLMDHPGNFRPSRYHVRNYGLFSISPFGDKAYTNGKEPENPLHLKQGESVSLRYGIYFHEGDTEAGKVADVYHQFVSAK